MKKLLALTLAMMMCLSCTAVMAEELMDQQLTLEPIEGVPVHFDAVGMTMNIANTAFGQAEVSEDNKALGFFDCYGTADLSSYFLMGLGAITGESWETDLIAQLQSNAAYKDIGYVTINEGDTWLTYTLTEADTIYFLIPVDETRLLQFCCKPASDGGFGQVMLQTLASIVWDDAAAAE